MREQQTDSTLKPLPPPIIDYDMIEPSKNNNEYRHQNLDQHQKYPQHQHQHHQQQYQQLHHQQQLERQQHQHQLQVLHRYRLYQRRRKISKKIVPTNMMIFVRDVTVMIVVIITLIMVTITIGVESIHDSTRTVKVYNQNINTENNLVITRVLERIDTFLKIPSDSCKRLMTLRNMNYFILDGMKSLDNNIIFDLLYTEASKEHSQVLIAYEDGTYFDMGDEMISIQYREPGFNGYDGNADILTKNDKNYKHWISCVNETNGELLNCTMPENTTYAACVNDCEYIPCQNNVSKSQFAGISIGDNDNNDVNNNNDNNITTWCINYKTKTVSIVEETLGYIPRTEFCLNQYGKKEERINHVIKTNTSGQQKYNKQWLGDCTYQDGTTLVNRSHIFGNYATCTNTSMWSVSRSIPATEYADETKNYNVCLNNDNDNDNNKTTTPGCYGAFYGGYKSDTFDHRTRSWYINTKQNQISSWSLPYRRYQTNHMCIMYSIPIYNLMKKNNHNNGNNQQPQRIQQVEQPYTLLNVDDNNNKDNLIFAGMIGTRFEINQIDNFLTEQYSQYLDNMKIFVVETIPPYNLIATSLNRSSHLVLNYVYKNNIQKECPIEYQYNTELCNVQRISILNYNYNDESSILSYAFIEHQHDNFQSSYLFFQDTPNATIGSKAYVAQRTKYQHENLQWDVYFIFTMNDSNNDSIQYNNNKTLYITIIIIATIGFLGCLLLFYLFYRKRKEKYMIMADYRFTCGFLLGCSTMNISSYTLLGNNNDPICMLRMWSFNGLIVCALSPLLVKLWRMAKIMSTIQQVEHIDQVEFTKLTNLQAWIYTLPLVIIELVILTIFTFIDPPLETEILGHGSTNVYYGVQHITCETETNAFFITQFIYIGLLILTGCVLAYRTRDLDPKFGETKQVAFSIFTIAMTSIVVVCLIQFLSSLSEANKAIIQAIGVLWSSFFSCLAFSLTRILELKEEIEERLSGGHSGSTHGSGYKKRSTANSRKNSNNNSVMTGQSSINNSSVMNGQNSITNNSVLNGQNSVNDNSSNHHEENRTGSEREPSS